MNLFFLIIILVLLVTFYYLFQNNYNLKNKHQAEIDNLNAIISELLIIQSKHSSALQMSDDLLNRLKNSRVEIDKKLLNLQSELIEKLINNKLVE